jgi:hypothetical protein
MSLTSNTKRFAYDLDTWVKCFSEAPRAAKPTVAVQWLEGYIAHIVLNGPPISGSVVLPLVKHIVPVREMAAAIPANHRVRRLLVSGSPARLTFVLHLLRYLDLSSPLDTLDTGTQPTLARLTRDMWLSPALDERTAALLQLAGDKDAIDEMSRSGDRLLRCAAWDVASENDMRDELVIAAAKITLAVYLDAYSAKGGPPICNAIGMILASNEMDDPSLSAELPATLAKEMVVAYPAVSLMVLQHINGDDRFRSRRLHGSAPNSAGMFESLVTWLPGSRDAIALACDMGLSYTQTLEQLATVGRHTTATLPEGVAP